MDISAASPKAILRKDYQPAPYAIDRVDLTFELSPEATLVKSRLAVRRLPGVPADAPLVLNGEKMELLELLVNDQAPAPGSGYQVTDSTLTLHGLPERFVINATVRIAPKLNTALEGLYMSSGRYFTQCEAEGFRRITYFLDRPDVMARYTTTIIADKATCPVLLSNGNRIGGGDLGDGRHFARWEDPFPKPTYLFALVAGDLGCLRDSFTTRSGRTVALEIYAAHEDIAKCDHAMASLKNSMRWDEERYGLEYDLDIYMIVAVSDFNMGAMENKGLNIFNTKYVLATPDTATDLDFQEIERVIAHEYFHNWTGNRVTCRDWFQLSLKEGLTVFRDQEFSADMNSAAVKRIEDVQRLRTGQFPEDAGPMAHPVRPDSYIEINNFYTPTVYIKGAEVVRMYQTLLSRDGFRKGMDLYFQRHDGQAVTCDDFRAAMADANKADLAQFERWYDQAGTPTLTVRSSWSEAEGALTLTVRQSCPPTPGQPGPKRPFLIPLALGLIGPDGLEREVRLANEATGILGTRVLTVTEAEQSFKLVGLDARPVPSLLRDFSAPVKLDSDLTDGDLAFLMAHDSDAFARWEAGQSLAVKRIFELMSMAAAGRAPTAPADLIAALRKTLTDPRLDPALVALCLSLPSEAYLAELMPVADVDAIASARDFLRAALGRDLKAELTEALRQHRVTGPYAPTAQQIARRSLFNAALDLLAAADQTDALEICARQAVEAANMTDRLAALVALIDTPVAAFAPARDAALTKFAADFARQPLVMDKWFAKQALSRRPGTLDAVKALMRHPAFDIKNPNKVYALLGSFAGGNRRHFHAVDGSGYAFIADQVIALDRINAQVASRIVLPLAPWRKFDPQRQALMKAELARIRATPGLSPDVTEIVVKSLEG